MDLKEYIKSLILQQLEEESTTAGVPGYMTPKAFSPKGQKKNAATKYAEKEGWKTTKGMPKHSKVYDYKEMWPGKKSSMNETSTDIKVGDKVKYNNQEWTVEKIFDNPTPQGSKLLNLKSLKGLPSANHILIGKVEKINMNELEIKKAKGKGRRYIPPTFPFNEKLLEPFELSKTKEPIKLFKLVSKGEEYILLASPFVKNALESMERGRGSLEKDRQSAYSYSANLTNYLRDNLNPMTRVAIKKSLQNAKPGPGGYFPINLTVTKDKSGELLIKNPLFDSSEDIQSTLYEVIKEELLNESSYYKFKNEVKYRTKAEQLHKAIREVKRKLQEIDRIVEYTQRMKQELSEGDGIQYWNRTNTAVAAISEMVSHLNNKIKNLNQ